MVAVTSYDEGDALVREGLRKVAAGALTEKEKTQLRDQMRAVLVFVSEALKRKPMPYDEEGLQSLKNRAQTVLNNIR